MRKPTNLFTSLFLPTSLALSMSLVGCGDKPANNGAATESEPSPSETFQADVISDELDTRELADVQVLNINNGVEPSSLDPQKVSGLYEFNVIRQQLEGLVTTDRQGKTIPAMAESWDNDNNKVWTFKIRDAKWSNGDPVTAEDFAYGLRRLLDPATAAPYGSYLVDAKIVNAAKVNAGELPPEELGIKALDDKTLQITLDEPVPYFVDMLVIPPTFPPHKATVEKFGDKWTDPENIVVNGAYKITDWRINDKIVMKRNPNYYNNDKTVIEEVNFYTISDPKSSLARYKTGGIDLAGVPGELLESIEKEYPDEIIRTDSICTGYFNLNNQRPPFDDVKVRRAIGLALNRDIITSKVFGRGEKPAYQFTPEAIGTFNRPEWADWTHEQRVAEAIKLLNEAGYNESNPLKFEILYTTDENNKKLGAAIQSTFKQDIGFVDVELTNKEWKTFLDTTNSGNFDASRYVWCGDYNEASTFLNLMKTGNSNNLSKYSNPEYDAIMNKTLEEGVTDEQRNDLYKQAEAILDRDMPALLINYGVGVSLQKPYLMNWPSHDPMGQWKAKDVSIAKH